MRFPLPLLLRAKAISLTTGPSTQYLKLPPLMLLLCPLIKTVESLLLFTNCIFIISLLLFCITCKASPLLCMVLRMYKVCLCLPSVCKIESHADCTKSKVLLTLCLSSLALFLPHPTHITIMRTTEFYGNQPKFLFGVISVP